MELLPSICQTKQRMVTLTLSFFKKSSQEHCHVMQEVRRVYADQIQRRVGCRNSFGTRDTHIAIARTPALLAIQASLDSRGNFNLGPV